MTNTFTNLIPTLISNLPWQAIINWIWAVVVPFILVLMKQHAKTSAVLDAVIQGVELAGKNMTKFDECKLKATIANVSVDAGTQPALHPLVQEITNNQEPPK